MSLLQYISLNANDPNNIDEAYLRRLVSMPPTMLEAERAKLQQSLDSLVACQRTLAASHKSDFLGSKAIMDKLSDLLADLGQSSSSCLEIGLASPKIPERAYQLLQSLLADEFVVIEKIDHIQELLSLPELVRDNVQSGNFGSALDLASMTDRLSKRFPRSALVQKLRSDVATSVDGMEEILLRTLRHASRLPQLIRAVTFLRRLETTDLERLFIDSRWEFLQSQWQAIPQQLQQTQHLAFLKRVVEIFREHVFATINGYQTIFKDDELSSSNIDAPNADAAPKSDGNANSVPNSASGESGIHHNTRLGKFARNSLQSLLGYLQQHAPLITDKADRSSLWLQLAFCAQSLGRIDCDFWPLLDSRILSKEEWIEAAQHQRDMAKRASGAARE